MTRAKIFFFSVFKIKGSGTELQALLSLLYTMKIKMSAFQMWAHSPQVHKWRGR